MPEQGGWIDYEKKYIRTVRIFFKKIVRSGNI